MTEKQGDRYPSYIPPALAEVLGMPPFELDPWFRALREVGVEVPPKYEGEMASALFFLIPFALSHPDDWRGGAIAELKRIQEGGAHQPLAFEIAPGAIVRALGASVSALRSYQYGNASPDLAKEIADAGEQALTTAGYPMGFAAVAGS